MPIKRRRAMSEINVVPYIDVMLVLLVIFMITTPLMNQGVHVNLPKAAAKPIFAKTALPIIVTVDSRGNYYLNVTSQPDQPIVPQQLVTRVAAELQLAKSRHENRLVMVKGDASVDYGKVMSAMVLLQQAGAENVGLMTKNPPNKS